MGTAKSYFKPSPGSYADFMNNTAILKEAIKIGPDAHSGDSLRSIEIVEYDIFGTPSAFIIHFTDGVHAYSKAFSENNFTTYCERCQKETIIRRPCKHQAWALIFLLGSKSFRSNDYQEPLLLIRFTAHNLATSISKRGVITNPEFIKCVKRYERERPKKAGNQWKQKNYLQIDLNNSNLTKILPTPLTISNTKKKKIHAPLLRDDLGSVLLNLVTTHSSSRLVLVPGFGTLCATKFKDGYLSMASQDPQSLRIDSNCTCGASACAHQSENLLSFIRHRPDKFWDASHLENKALIVKIDLNKKFDAEDIKHLITKQLRWNAPVVAKAMQKMFPQLEFNLEEVREDMEELEF